MTVTAYSAHADESGATLDVGPFDIAEGDYLLAFAGNYGGPQGVTLASTDAELTLIPHYDVTDWWPNTIACGKLRNAPTKAGTTLRATWGGACTYRWLVVLRVRPDADCEVWAHSWQPGMTGEGTSVNGNAIDTIGDRVLLVGAASNGGGTAWSSLTLGGSAPDAIVSPLSRGRVAYRALSANASAQALAATLASSNEWAAWTMALRECPVGASRTSIRVNSVNESAYAHITPPAGGVLVTAWAKPDMPTGDYPHDRGNLILFELGGTAVYAQVLTCNGTVDSALTFASKFNANSMNGAGSSFSAYAGFGDLCMINETTVRRLDERDLWGWNFLAYWYYYDPVGENLYFHIWAKPGHGEEIRHAFDEYTLAEARAALVATGMPSGVAATWTPGDITTLRLGFSSNDTPTRFDMTAVRIYEQETLPTLAEIDAISENPDADTGAWGDYVFEWSGGAPVLSDRSGNAHTLSATGTLYEGDSFALAASAGPLTYSVTYDGNGSTGGAVPTDGSSPYDESDTVTVLGNSGSLARPGYAFSGWNTAADGSGTSYAPSATFSMPAASVTLYAQWTKGSRIINHDNVDASVLSAGEVSAVAAAKVYFEHASTGVDVVGDSTTDTSAGLNNDDTQDCGLKLLHTANSRYLFNRDYDESAYDATWFATHSGLQNNMRGNPTPATKVSGFVSNLATMASAVDIAFFKYCWIDVWTETEGYISDGAAAAASDIATVVGLESTYGIDIPLVTMPLQSNASYAARQAYNDALRVYCEANDHWLWDFADIEAWDTTRHVDGSDREVAVSSYVTVDGGHLSEAGELRLAQSYWLLVSGIVGYTPTYTVTYDGNEATGGTVPTDASSPYEEDATVTVLGNTGSLVRSGYVFAGWNTAADGSGTAYDPADTFEMPAANVTLYAQWLTTPSAVTATKGGSVQSAMRISL